MFAGINLSFPESQNDGSLDGNDGNDGNPDGNNESLTQNETLVLQAISKNPSLSAAKISFQVGFSKPSVERILRSLKKKGADSQGRIHTRQMDHFKVKAAIKCQNNLKRQGKSVTMVVRWPVHIGNHDILPDRRLVLSKIPENRRHVLRQERICSAGGRFRANSP